MSGPCLAHDRHQPLAASSSGNVAIASPRSRASAWDPHGGRRRAQLPG